MLRKMKRPTRAVLSLTALGIILGINSIAALASTAPGLGTATSFAILAGTTITNNTAPSTTVVTGDVGLSPGLAAAITNMTGPPNGTIVGATHTGSDPLAISAKNDLTTAYGVAASSPCNFNKTGQNLGGMTLTPGTYCQTTAPTLTGILTLSGNGVFIFQIGSTLVTAPGASVVLTGGAQACNVFWQVSSSATLDTTTAFVGTIMALTSISLNNGASIQGRALARNGAVTLINNVITAPTGCNAATVVGPTATATPAATATATPAVVGAPNGGGGPPQGQGFPWILAIVGAMLGSAGAVSIGLSRRSARRTR